MPTLKFFVPSPAVTKAGKRAGFPGTNEMIDAANTSRYALNDIKREVGVTVEQYARVAARQARWQTPEGQCHVTLKFIEPNHRRDPDNIYGAAKLIMDGLTGKRGSKRFGAGVIRDDSQRYVDLECRLMKGVVSNDPGVIICVEFPNEDSEGGEDGC